MLGRINGIRASYVKKLKRHWYTFLAKRHIKSYGVELRVNNRCLFSGDVKVGDHCNFNGMKIMGGG